LLEVIVRPPISVDEALEEMDVSTEDLNELFAVVEQPKAVQESDMESKPATIKDNSVASDIQPYNSVVNSEETTTVPKANLKEDTPPTFEDPTPDSPVETTIITQATDSSLEEGEESKNIQSALGMTFDEVGGLDAQLDAIARRVLASRANPAAARRLGVSHVRGILLSGPPGCGKTLLARELARLLDAREPQIVNGPEILDKFIGEAEKKVRALFAPAQREYAEVGDDSALHIIVLDEMDAIAKKRGTVSSDTTGVRDSVVNQLLSCMDVSYLSNKTPF
jgi:SpoVK/Ycf46/Vps4 family AAA+-type ATPase